MLYYDHSTDKLRVDAGGNSDRLTVDADGDVAIARNLDVDGTANLDAVDIDGAVQVDNTITVGANDQGYDIIFYGDTASANVTWDTSEDDLIFNGAARVVVPDGQLVLGDAAVTATAAELNLLDDVTATTAELNYSDTGAAVGTVVASKVVTADANKDVSALNNVTVDGYVHFDATPADNKSSGITATFTAGEALEIGELCYIHTNGKMKKAFADSSAPTTRCVAMALAGIALDDPGLFLLQGFFQCTGSFPTYTAGDTLYVPEAEVGSKAVPEAAAPADDGDLVQVVGFAVGADSIYFNPNSTVIEVA